MANVRDICCTYPPLTRPRAPLPLAPWRTSWCGLTLAQRHRIKSDRIDDTMYYLLQAVEDLAEYLRSAGY